MPKITKPLSPKCNKCGGGGGRTVPKQERIRVRVQNIKTGKMEWHEEYKTTQVWQECGACRGSGLA